MRKNQENLYSYIAIASVDLDISEKQTKKTQVLFIEVVRQEESET